MQISNKKQDGLKLSFTIKIATNEIEAKINSKLNDLQKMAKLPGFRPGKVPAKYLEQRFGASLKEEVFNEEIQASSKKLFEDEKIKLASRPDIDVKEYKAGTDFEFTLNFESLPEIEELDYSKLNISKYKVIIPESEITKQIEVIQNQQQDFKKIEGKDGAKKNQAVVIDYVGSVDGKEFAGGKAENHRLVLGSKSFIDNFEEQLVGCMAGSEKIVKVTFPKEYHAAELKGKKAEFKVKIKEILDPIKAELNDEFAKKNGAKDVADLKNKIRENFEKYFNDQSKNLYKKELFDYIEKSTKFDLPEAMVNEEYNILIQQFLRDNNLKSEDEAQKEKEKEFVKAKKDNLNLAKRRVRSGLILSDLSEKYKISASEKDIREAMQAQFANYPGNPEDILKFYQGNPKMLEHLKGPIIEDKAVSYIIEKALPKEKEVTIEQFKKIYDN
jgi:trigger factor